MIVLAASSAEAGRGAASIKYLPDDSSAALVCDVAKSRGTPMFKKFFKLAREQNTTLDTLAANLAVDKLVDTIIVGANPNKHAVLVLEGRVDKLLAEAKKTATKSDTYSGITFWTTPDGDVAIVDKKLVIATTGDMNAVIDRAKDKKAKGPLVVRTFISATSSSSSVFGGLMLDSAQRSDLNKQLGAEPQWGAFSLTLSSKVVLDARLKFSSDADAATATKAMNGLLTPETKGRLEGFVGKEFSDSITVEQQQAFARFGATMTADETDKIISLVKMMM
jgi:hypothetical protein